MPKKELAKDRQNSPRTQKVIDWLHGGRIPVDPVQAWWHDEAATGGTFAYYNFRLGRFEWARGRIPEECLWEYERSGAEDGTD